MREIDHWRERNQPTDHNPSIAPGHAPKTWLSRRMMLWKLRMRYQASTMGNRIGCPRASELGHTTLEMIHHVAETRTGGRRR